MSQQPIDEQRHHDGYGLNDRHLIVADERDHENGGGASHHYSVYSVRPDQGNSQILADIQFQHGPRNVEGSVDGITDQALVAVLLDRYYSYQAGPFACRENALVITKLEEALMWMRKRNDDRARRGVLGTLKK